MRDDRLIIDYLLDAVPEADAERLDELSVVDDDFAAELRRTEHDLVDAYVNGELSNVDLDRFRTHYLPKPGAVEKVRFAEAWRAYRPQSSPALSPPGAWRRTWRRTGRSTGQSTEPSRLDQATDRRWPDAARWGLAAAALLTLVAAGYLVRADVNLRRQIDAAGRERAALDRRVQALTQELEVQRGARADALQELERARAALSATRPGSPPGTPATVVASILLLPPLRGGGRGVGAGGTGELPSVAVPQGGTGEVQVQLQLDPDDFARYRVELTRGQGARVLWRSEALPAGSQNNIRVVSVRLPVRLLTPGVYNLDLTGISNVGGADLIASYVFRVVVPS